LLELEEEGGEKEDQDFADDNIPDFTYYQSLLSNFYCLHFIAEKI
jgi:hypothetical protein